MLLLVSVGLHGDVESESFSVLLNPLSLSHMVHPQAYCIIIILAEKKDFFFGVKKPTMNNTVKYGIDHRGPGAAPKGPASLLYNNYFGQPQML